jgi:integrase
VHAVAEKRARPLEIEVVQRIDQWLDQRMDEAKTLQDQGALLRHTRNRSLLLLGFWRGFRSDELVNLRVENVQITPGEGLVCFLGSSKTDRQSLGRHYSCPALSQLCPVTACQAWLSLADLTQGPVYRKIDRWGRVGQQGLNADSLIPLLRSLFRDVGLEGSEEYSSHSMRRGFATWARDSGWDLKSLMAYVGWKDVKSAMRYLDVSDASVRAKFESSLASLASLPALAKDS